MKQSDYITIISKLAQELESQQLDIYFKDRTIESLNKRIAEAEASKLEVKDE